MAKSPSIAPFWPFVCYSKQRNFRYISTTNFMRNLIIFFFKVAFNSQCQQGSGFHSKNTKINYWFLLKDKPREPKNPEAQEREIQEVVVLTLFKSSSNINEHYHIYFFWLGYNQQTYITLQVSFPKLISSTQQHVFGDSLGIFLPQGSITEQSPYNPLQHLQWPSQQYQGTSHYFNSLTNIRVECNFTKEVKYFFLPLGSVFLS